MKKRILGLILAALLIISIFSGCSKDSKKEETEGRYSLKVATLSGASSYVPAYICEEEGRFEAAGLDIERFTFSGGPVMVEALASDSWDVAIGGVGAVLSGTIGQDAVVISACREDAGTHMLWARPDHPIVLAGQGNNELNTEIYGNAESWKGAEVLCSSGTTLHIMLAKTLTGFGLGMEDIKFTIMDAPSANTAFISGEGDVAATWSALSLNKDKEQFVMVSSGELAETGVVTNIIANPKSLADPEKREAIKIFVREYYKAVDFANENHEATAQYMADYFSDDGIATDYDLAMKNLALDPFIDLDETYEMMTATAEGGEYTVMEGRILEVLGWFVEFGNYTTEQEAELLNDKFDSSIVKELYEESK